MEGYDGSISTQGVARDLWLKQEKDNIIISMGEDLRKISFMFIENYTLKNRFKWWLFCKVFPFRVEKFEKREEMK